MTAVTGSGIKGLQAFAIETVNLWADLSGPIQPAAHDSAGMEKLIERGAKHVGLLRSPRIGRSSMPFAALHWPQTITMTGCRKPKFAR
jgi:hypothetical protein